MKLLKRLLLINWYYFWNELVEFDEINFLTGKNKAGKSTIIDAMQLVLLGDTSGYYFNKAANERSARTLKGYLRGEIGDDGDVGFNYLREGRFSSYIALEFYDDVKNSWFTLGVVFDCYEDGNDEHRFFILDSQIPENRFIVNKVPMSYKELRMYCNKNYKKGRFDFPESNRSYQDTLKGKLGGLKNRYFSLFKKAVPFSPAIDIEQFITENVCDVRNPIDISLMQDNIRHYKRLEYDADLMETRIQALQNIAIKHKAFYEENQRLEEQRYIIVRSQHQSAMDRLSLLNEERGRNNEDIARYSAKQAECGIAVLELTKKKEQLIADKLASNINTTFDRLQLKKKNLEDELNVLKDARKDVVQRLRKYGLIWRESAQRIIIYPELEQGKFGCFADGHLQKRWRQLCVYANQTLPDAKSLVDITFDQLGKEASARFDGIRDNVSQFKETAFEINHAIKRIKNEIEQRRIEYTQQLKDLEKGVKPYHPKLLELKQEITNTLKSKYGRTVEVNILADLLEIKDLRWTKAIEAYLHTQKFYLIIEPEYFIDALKVYDRLKFEKGYFDWGLLDTGKIAEIKSFRERESLAEEVLTDNKYARLFIDYTIGRLIKCDKVEQLREHDRAITDSCMLYQNYVARQLNPERWKTPYIGRKAVEEQIKARHVDLDSLEYDNEICENHLEALGGVIGMEAMNANEAENTLQVIKNTELIPIKEREYQSTVDELGMLDITWLVKIDDQIKKLEAQIRSCEKEEDDFKAKIVQLETTNGYILNEKIPNEKNNCDGLQRTIMNSFSEDWIHEKGEPRFLKELNNRRSAFEVYENFSSQLARTESQNKKKMDELISVRADYNRDYKMSYDINGIDNSSYDKELKELLDVKLPEYKKQIQDAKEKASEQFRDDFLAKLKMNIDTVKTQIDELNAALRESTFGSDRYRFVVNPKPEYKRYYDMITDEMLLEGYNVYSQVFRDKHRDAIDELFRQITDIDSELNADARIELEKNIKRFTDYKTYLAFDLIMTDDTTDRTQRLSKTLLKKSGGETQTPFYITILASFSQLYRIRQKNEAGNTMRLIIFDEAFSKMDSERIRESIKLLRKFSLQAVLSAPPEKIGDVAPLVNRNLCVIRNEDRACVKAFDSKRLIEENANGL
jgi:energy-coupling factor transporter ATP-binding protein EcfA2